jgi:hypothetical protein
MLAGVTLSLAANAHAQTETTIYNFSTTAPNSPNGCGTVFRLSLKNGVWSESLIHAFTDQDGGNSPDGLVFDAKGKLYGGTQFADKSRRLQSIPNRRLRSDLRTDSTFWCLEDSCGISHAWIYRADRRSAGGRFRHGIRSRR